MKLRKELIGMPKSQILREYKNWLTPNKFQWLNSCTCWDGLLLTFCTGSRVGACSLSFLMGGQGDPELLYKLGFERYELENLENLVMHWEGETYDSKYNDAECTLSRRSIYNYGIIYLNEWIAHLEKEEGVSSKTPETIVKYVKLEGIPEYDSCLN